VQTNHPKLAGLFSFKEAVQLGRVHAAEMLSLLLGAVLFRAAACCA